MPYPAITGWVTVCLQRFPQLKGHTEREYHPGR